MQVRLLKNASSVEEARSRKPLTFNTGSKDPQHIWNVSTHQLHQHTTPLA